MDELGFYSLGARELAAKIRESQNKVVAVVDYLGLRKDLDCYKEFRIGGAAPPWFAPMPSERGTGQSPGLTFGDRGRPPGRSTSGGSSSGGLPRSALKGARSG